MYYLQIVTPPPHPTVNTKCDTYFQPCTLESGTQMCIPTLLDVGVQMSPLMADSSTEVRIKYYLATFSNQEQFKYLCVYSCVRCMENGVNRDELLS